MKIIRHENAVELVPESDFEREALKFLKSSVGNGKVEWTDSWEQSGNLKFEKAPDWSGPGGR